MSELDWNGRERIDFGERGAVRISSNRAGGLEMLNLCVVTVGIISEHERGIAIVMTFSGKR